MNIDLEIKLDRPECMPVRAHEDDAGMDLKAMRAAHLKPSEQVIIGTGVRLNVPKGYVALAASRSGHGKRNVTLANSVGVIDSGYQGEVLVILTNNGTEDQYIKRLERICQIVIVPIPKVNMMVVSEFSEQSERGENGWGSTGKVELTRMVPLEEDTLRRKLTEL